MTEETEPGTTQSEAVAQQQTCCALVPWVEAGRPSGEEYAKWADAYWRANLSETNGEWKATLRVALGGRANPEQMVCRIF